VRSAWSGWVPEFDNAAKVTDDRWCCRFEYYGELIMKFTVKEGGSLGLRPGWLRLLTA